MEKHVSYVSTIAKGLEKQTKKNMSTFGNLKDEM